MMAITLYSIAIAPKPATIRGRLRKKPRQTRQSWPSRFSWIEIASKPATTQRSPGKNSSGSRHSWPSRFIQPRCRLSQRQTATVWEKFLGKPPIMAITLFLDRDRAKAGSNPAIAWEKVQRKSPIMAISLYSITIMPKPATGWEKFLGKPPFMTIFKRGGDGIGGSKESHLSLPRANGDILH